MHIDALIDRLNRITLFEQTLNSKQCSFNSTTSWAGKKTKLVPQRDFLLTLLAMQSLHAKNILLEECFFNSILGDLLISKNNLVS